MFTGGRACRDHPTRNTNPRWCSPVVELVETTPLGTPALDGAHRWSSLWRPPCRKRSPKPTVARRPFPEGLLDLPRSQGRPTAAGFAGRFAVLDTGARRERIWLVIGATARVWPRGIRSPELVPGGRACRDHPTRNTGPRWCSRWSSLSRPPCRKRIAEAGLGRRPFREGLLDPSRSQGRPSAAGFAGRFAVLDTGTGREKTWLAIGAAARVWRGVMAPPVVELVETTKPTTTTPFTEEKVAHRATYHPQIRGRELGRKVHLTRDNMWRRRLERSRIGSITTHPERRTR
ncbi:hypothetical protein J2S40_004549 [Nocardioides luteus]|nr:hypothetical protein [Nocardioides luteus]